MQQPAPDDLPFWDAVRAWADAAGFLLPQPEPVDGQPAPPQVPASVCANCPICQAAATLDQVNPEVVAELVEVARGLVGGIGSALARAAEQRLASGGTESEDGDQAPAEAPDDPADRRAEDAPDGDDLGEDLPG